MEDDKEQHGYDYVTEDLTDALFAIGEECDACVKVTNNSKLFEISTGKSARMPVRMHDVEVSALIDSGASSNLIDRHTAKLLNCNVRRTKRRLFTYGTR